MAGVNHFRRALSHAERLCHGDYQRLFFGSPTFALFGPFPDDAKEEAQASRDDGKGREEKLFRTHKNDGLASNPSAIICSFVLLIALNRFGKASQTTR